MRRTHLVKVLVAILLVVGLLVPSAAIASSPTAVTTLIPYRKGNVWGFCDQNKKMVIPAVYEGASRFSEGLAWITLNGKYGFINTRGKMVIPAVSAADTVGIASPRFSSVTQILDNGIMFKSVLVQSAPQMSIQSSGTPWTVNWGVEGYSLLGIKVSGLYTNVGWTQDGSSLATPNWVYHTSWTVFPNVIDQVSDQWLYYTLGYHGTGEALTQGRFGIGINGWDLLYYTKSLFTDVYWYGNYYAHVQ